jgi:hypothetical protein
MGNNWVDSQTALTENRLVQMSDFVTMTYADGNTAVTTATRRYLCTVPAKSIVVAAYCRIVTGFNAATNDYITVGSLADDDLLVNDLDVTTAITPIVTTVTGTTLPCYLATDTPIWVTYIYSSTAPTTGECEVAIAWVPWTESETFKTSVGT